MLLRQVDNQEIYGVAGALLEMKLHLLIAFDNLGRKHVIFLVSNFYVWVYQVFFSVDEEERDSTDVTTPACNPFIICMGIGSSA